MIWRCLPGTSRCLAAALAALCAGGGWALTQAPARDAFADVRRQVMENMGDVEYISYFSVGEQTIAGLFDTGSFELVIFSSACTTCGVAGKYDPAQSASHKNGTLNTMQTYGSGDTYSQEATDMVAIGPFEKRKQMFWEVTEARMPRLRTSRFQAVIGVGPPEAPAADAWADARRAIDSVQRYFREEQSPPAEARASAKEMVKGALELSESPTLLDNFGVRTFSICMGAHPGSDGYFIWHDKIHTQKPSLFMRVPIVGDHSWSATLKNVRLSRLEARGGLNSTSLGCDSEEGCSVLIDSGTSLIAAPGNVIKQIQDIIDHVDGDCTDMTSFPTLEFDLGGNKLSLPPDAYMAAVVGTVPQYLERTVALGSVGGARPFQRRPLGAREVILRNLSVTAPVSDLADDGAAASQCKMLLMESYMESDSGGPIWIFGFPFFRKYYSTFDVGEDSSSRALYLAEASDDCRPAETSSLARSLPHLRRIDISKLAATTVRVGHSKVRRI